MSELHQAIDQLAKDTIFMSNLNLARRLQEYQTIIGWDKNEAVSAIIAEIRIPWEMGRLGGMLAIYLLTEITGENPAHLAYKDVGAGFQAVSVEEATQAWIDWYDDFLLNDDEIPL